MSKPQNAIIRAEYSYLLANIEVRQYEGGENTLATPKCVANICPSKRLATEVRNSCYSSRKVVYLTGSILLGLFQ